VRPFPLIGSDLTMSTAKMDREKSSLPRVLAFRARAEQREDLGGALLPKHSERALFAFLPEYHLPRTLYEGAKYLFSVATKILSI